MSERRLFRLGAVAAAISGVAIVAGKVLMLLPDPQAGEVLDFFSPLFGLFAVVAVFLWQRRQSGTFGVVAFVVMFIGLALVTSLDYFGAFIRLELTEAVRDELMEGSPGVVAGTAAAATSRTVRPDSGSRKSGTMSRSGMTTKSRPAQRGWGMRRPGSSTTVSPRNTTSTSSDLGAPG